MSVPLGAARSLLDRAASIVVMTHIRPDGDAIGSMLGLGRSLALRGKQVTSVLAEAVPDRFRDLPGAESIRPDLPSGFDLLITVDCSTLDRLGFSERDLGRKPDFNFDHHPTNTRFAAYNFIDPQASATAEVIYELCPELDLPLDSQVAANWLAGLVSDTLGFRTRSVSAKTLRIAAELVKMGAPLAELYERILLQNSFAALKYWGPGLKRLERRGGLIWTHLRAEDRERAGYGMADDADLINLLGTIEAAELVLLFVEQPDGRVKVSWRSLTGFNVAQVAELFGGGGHEAASGAMITGGFEEVSSRVLQTTREAFESDRPSRPESESEPRRSYQTEAEA